MYQCSASIWTTLPSIGIIFAANHFKKNIVDSLKLTGNVRGMIRITISRHQPQLLYIEQMTPAEYGAPLSLVSQSPLCQGMKCATFWPVLRPGDHAMHERPVYRCNKEVYHVYCDVSSTYGWCLVTVRKREEENNCGSSLDGYNSDDSWWWVFQLSHC